MIQSVKSSVCSAYDLAFHSPAKLGSFHTESCGPYVEPDRKGTRGPELSSHRELLSMFQVYPRLPWACRTPNPASR